MYCVQCGQKLPNSVRFCSNCGAAIPVADGSTSGLGTASSILTAMPQEIIAQRSVSLSADALIEHIESCAFKQIQQSDIYNEYFHSCHSPIPNSRRDQFQKVKEIYRNAFDQGELFLFYYDNTFIRNAKESFLLTDKGIHASSDRLFSGMIPYQDIQTIDIKVMKMFPNLIINRRFTIPIRFMYDERYEFAEDLQTIVIPTLLRL